MQDIASGNDLLDLLTEIDAHAVGRVLAQVERVEVRPGTVLQRASENVGFAWFPIDGMLALSWPMAEGLSVDTLGVGRDGAVYATPGFDVLDAPYNVSAPLAGAALRVPTAAWRDMLAQSDGVRQAMTRYAELLFERSQQALACRAKHDVESRLCQWLLQMHRWRSGNALDMTHRDLAKVLGVRRTTITLLARTLQDAGIISYRRGVIEITDHYALQQASCGCEKTGRGHPTPRKALAGWADPAVERLAG
jgi:hypothetical protein